MKTVDVVGWLVGVKYEKERGWERGDLNTGDCVGVIALKLKIKIKISDDWEQANSRSFLPSENQF